MAVNASDDEISNLYNALDNRDQTIADLEKKLESIINSTEGVERHLRLESDLEQARNEIIQQRQIIAELEAQVGENALQNDNDAADLKDMRDVVEMKNKIVETLRKQLLEAEQNLDKIKNQNKSGKGEVYRLETENLRLRELVQELEGNEEALIEEVGLIANDKCSLEFKVQEKSRELEEIKLIFDEKIHQCDSYESENALLVGKLNSCETKENNLLQKILKLKEDHSSEVEELKRELEKERRRNKDIDLKAALSFGKSIDENQMLQLDELKAELKIVSIRAERYESENKQLQRDIDCACIALQEAKLEKSEQLFETESKLSAVSQKAHEQMKNMASKVEEWKAKAKDLEEELNNIQAKLQTSEERNAWYERENGLTDVIRRQKQLEVDVRRRDMDRKKLLLEIGRKDDKISLLVKTCEVLKTKIVSVEDDNLPIDDDELRAILKLDESSLHAQNKELAHQIDQLEGERNTLLKRLRNNAAVVYDDGRFLGLSSAQMQEVIEFAGNLKEGTQQLPLTDKSVQLNAELDELKAHRRSDLFTIDRLEKEIETLKLMRDSDDNTMTRELGTLRTSLEDIQSQNALLQEELIAISRYNKYQGSCAKCSLKEPDSINISQSSKDQLEKILGEILEATISASKLSDVIQQHQLMKENVEQCLSKNNELSAYASNKSNVGDIMKEKHGLEVELQNKSANLELAKCHITDLESQLNEKNRFFHEGELVSRVAVRKISKRSVYTQVESDRAETRRINVELQATRQALLISEDELLKAEKNMRRLQETVNQQSYDKKRILAAHKALRSILDEKKYLIAKYRQKETKKKPVYIPANSKRTIIKETARGEKDVQIATEISTLMESLEEMSKLVKEKDNTIKCLKTQILELQNELKDSISKHSKACETLQQCRDAKGQLTKKVLLLEESLDDERTKRSLLTGDLEKEITAKNDKIESLTRSLQRVKSNLQSKSEELIESAAAQAELRRTKSALSAARRRSANGEKALSATLEKIANATEDNEKLHKEINCSRQQLAQLREDKMTSDKRLRIAREKLKEMRLCTNSSADKKEESKLESIEEDYKSLIFSLKNEITDLRGVVAASKLKKEADIKISATNPHAKGNRTSATLRGISSKTLSPANLSASKARLEGTNPSKSVQTRGEDNWICLARKVRELTEEIDRLTNTIDDKEKEIRTISNDKAILLERIFSLDESRNPKKSEKLDEFKCLFDRSQAEVERLKMKVKEMASNSMILKGNVAALAKLEDENRRLRVELNSFDLEFFEQLEDLKYKYNEAKMKGY